jgi:hypothetical protein
MTALNRDPPERPRMLFSRLSFRAGKTLNLAAVQNLMLDLWLAPPYL